MKDVLMFEIFWGMLVFMLGMWSGGILQAHIERQARESDAEDRKAMLVVTHRGKRR